VRSLGIDVGVTKGLDLVLLDDTLRPVETARRVDPSDLANLIQDMEPDVVAIDSPPAWGLGKGSRRTERELRAFGIQSYGTPRAGERDDHPFYAWMKVGFRAFEEAARAGFPRFGSGSVRGKAIEVFPHASAVALSGCVPSTSVRKREFRTRVLRSQRVETDGLRSMDQVDAALAALTGLLALRGRHSALGDPREGVIVLPVSSLPAHPFRRCPEAKAADDVQVRFPGMTPCGCGDPACREMTSREFAPGHDARRKSMLWTTAREGQTAVDELRRRKWELPPEMR
jgi:predicted nuclease with RNAse H fold